MALPTDPVAVATALTEALVGFDTESAKSNLPLIDFVEDHLRQLGVAFVRTPNEAGSKAAIFATVGPMADGGIVLSGHTDVVPVKGQKWSSDPYTLRSADGRLYGRGTCDMKGFAAVALAMIPAFQAAALGVPIHILLSYDEEITCLGPMDIIARFGAELPRPRAVIVGEPTMMQVVDAHKSIATYATTVRGHEAHSAKPGLGANAIEGACALVSELYRIDDALAAEGDPSGRFDPPRSTISVGTIAGGTARNILAGECSFGWEFRGLPGVAYDTALRRLDAYADGTVLPRLNRWVRDAAIETTVQVEIPGLIAEPVSEATTLALKATRSNATSAVSYVTEAGRFQTAGIPTVVCGPGNIDQAHQADEFLAVSQLEAGVEFMLRLIEELRS